MKQGHEEKCLEKCLKSARFADTVVAMMKPVEALADECKIF
jgi:hypothetical protein